MSEHGSFTTEYIYCDKCLKAAKKILISNHKYHRSIQMILDGELYPIIAGKMGGTGGGDEYILMEYELIPELEKTICHPLRIAVLAETNEIPGRIFVVEPEKVTA